MSDPIEIMARAVVGYYIAGSAGELKVLSVIAALDAAGYAIVPKEPTEEMVNAVPTVVCTEADIYSAMVEAGRVKP